MTLRPEPPLQVEADETKTSAAPIHLVPRKIGDAEEDRPDQDDLARTLRELKLFRALLDQSSDAIKVIEPKTLRLLDVNERSCVQLGYSREELLAMTIYDISPGFNEKLRDELLQQIAEDGSALIERIHRRKDGSVFPVEVTLRQVQLDRTYVVAVSRDITVRKQTEAQLQESERKHRAVHDLSPVGICWIDGTGHFLNVNPKFCEIAGRTEQDLLQRSFRSITHADDANSNLSRLQQLFSGEIRRFEVEKRIVRADGSIRWVEVLVAAVAPQGQVAAWHIAMVQDITDRKQAELALRQSEAREKARSKELETVLQAVPIGVCIADDTDCTHMTGNRAVYEQLGTPVGTNISKSAPLTDRPAFRVLENGHEVSAELLPIQQAAATGQVVYGRLLSVIREDGSIRETMVNVVPLFDEEGKPRGAVAASVDITEMKRTEEQLRQSEQRFRIALEGSPIKVFNQDRNLRYTWVYNLHEGWNEQDYLGKTDAEIFTPEDAAKMTAIKRPVLESGQGTRQEFSLTAGGKIFHCDITVEALRDATGAVVGLNCACVDVTHLRELSEELRVAKEKLSEEKLYLEQSIDSELGFGEIIGRSRALKEVMDNVGRVAASDATVLILGETGTGKELIARALHRMSGRNRNSFIKLNCAAIPSGLLESELFGHEKGAFTGAVSKKIGRIELADGGTLFLDEIGEIPLNLQPKLLRVLQDQEFERLGGTQTIKVNFRLVAATNRDLPESVNRREFRSDLYYRLNVFPIRTPPLRERREDIPLLVEHFVRKFETLMRKKISSVPTKTMELLVQCDWPGNIRQLENFIERSVILTSGSVLYVQSSELACAAAEGRVNTLRENERELIVNMLRECRGRLGGPAGAAARLGMKRTTLQSKLLQMAIDLTEYRKQ